MRFAEEMFMVVHRCSPKWPVWGEVVVCLFALLLGGAQAATITLSGTVTDLDTGAPIVAGSVGATRVASLGAGQPDALIPVEATTSTNASGQYVFQIDSSTPNLDRVLVFTRVSGAANRLYDGVPFAGNTPTHADVAKPGVVEINFSQSVSGINFAIENTSSKTTYLLAMSDGICLATDVYLPPGDGPWPVILYRTTYGRTSDNVGAWPSWNSQGYACVTQDIRGCYDSEDIFRGYFDDGWGENQDGFETCEWIQAQDWCNGKICTLGGSARGISQNFLASSLPSGLVCQSIEVAASNLYTQSTFQGGAYRHELAEGWMAGRGPESLQYLHEVILARPYYDDEFWPYLNPETRYHLINWPIVNRGGWYDCFQRGTINNFLLIQHNGQPNAEGKQRLIIGPYGHGSGGEFSWPANCYSAPAAYGNTTRWFDYWVKGAENGVMDQPPVCYYVLGDVDHPEGPGNEWRFADDWPVPATEVPMYFHDAGLLSSTPPAAAEASNTYGYDPVDPVPTHGGANLSIANGPHDQNPQLSRSDVIVFTTPVLDSYVEITGTVLVRLYASSSAVDTDFTAKLCDVYPDGASMLVCDGIIRARHRNTQRYSEFMTPGTVYEFEIDLWDTCIVFNAGHRIRVAISSSNYPRFDANPNTGEPFNEHTHTVPATNTLYHDAAHPSHILFRVTGPDSNGDGVPDPADVDNDGLPDTFEWPIINYDPDDAVAALADVLPGDDFDQDGYTNAEEYIHGTNPLDDGDFPGPPSVDFTADVNSGYAPLTVQFTDQSANNPTSWLWDFGDGSGASTDQNPMHTYEAAGLYTVSLTAENQFGSNSVTKTGFIEVVARTIRADRSFWYYKYLPGSTLDVTVTVHNDGPGDISVLKLEERIPSGWSYDSVVSGAVPDSVPAQGATGTLLFEWLNVPAFPAGLTFRVSVPSGQTGDATFSGGVLYQRSGGVEQAAAIGGLGTVAERIHHSLDHSPADGFISVSEILRVIQFYNLSGYHCATGTEDGYEPGPPGAPDMTCAPHDCDYNPQDWQSGVSEILRVIQFYNLGGCHVAEDTEDGYAPGAAPVGTGMALRADADAGPSGDGTQPALEAARSMAAAGGAIEVGVTLTHIGDEPISALGLVETLPPGWVFDSLGDDIEPPVIAPVQGDSGELDFVWIAVPQFPATVRYSIHAEPGAASVTGIDGVALYRTSGPEQQAKVAYAPFDINGDGNVDAADLQLVVNAALNIGQPPNGDVDASGAVNAVDVQLVVNAILSWNPANSGGPVTREGTR